MSTSSHISGLISSAAMMTFGLLASSALSASTLEAGQGASARYNQDLPAHTCPAGMKCALNFYYHSEPFLATRLDSYWTDGTKGTEPDPDCSSVLNTVNLDEHAYNDAGEIVGGPDGIPDDPDDVDNYQYHVNKEVRMLDIYRPESWSSRGRKVLFWVHGGAWVDSTREMYSWLPTVFTKEKGWVTVVVEYRELGAKTFMASDCPTREACAETQPEYMEKSAWWPDPEQDVADAFAWVVQNISKHNGDPRQIYVAGQSAGGNLVSLLAVKPEYEALRPFMKGVISMSPPSDLGALAYTGNAYCQGMYRTLFAPFFEHCTTTPGDGTGRPECTSQDFDVASPSLYVDSNESYPRMLVMAGGPGGDDYFDGDMPCLRADVQTFAELMPDETTTYVDLDGYGHVSEVSSLEFASAAVEPTTIAYGDYGSCQMPFGMNDGVKVARNVTQMILSWVQCGNPAGC